VSRSSPDVLATLPERTSFVRDPGGAATHAVIPYEDYVQLIALQAAREGEAILANPNTEWLDADEVFASFAAQGIARVRKARGLTQKQLGEKLGIPQSQVSRLEKNPDASSMRLIKRVAKALGVSVHDLMA
jgi:DNA-binding XRE family transcriptional regulator